MSPATNFRSGPPRTAVPAAARPLHALVRVYRFLAAGRPSPCRFDPSCSTYALEALQLHGALRGARLILRRLARCHPFGGWGWDPVPLPRRGARAPHPIPTQQKAG